MSIFFDVVFAIGVGLIATVVVAFLFGRTGPWASIPIFFSLVFLAAWAGGVWIEPIGPALWGVYWLPFTIFGVIVAILLAVAAFPGRQPASRRNKEDRDSRRVFDGYFYILVGVLAAAIAIGYLV